MNATPAHKTMGPFKTGLDWVYRSILLFQQNPPKWLVCALLYVTLFVMLPSIPGMPVLISLFVILFWPLALALFIGVYREADLGRDTEPRQLLEEMKPHVVRLVTLGGVFLVYSLLTGFLVKDEMAQLALLVEQKSGPEVIMPLALPLISKMLLLLVPMIMASWFSPMLVAYQGFSVVEAIKHSLWQTWRNMVAITVAWLLLTVALLGFLLVVGLIIGAVATLVALLGALLMSMVVLGCLLIVTYFMLAIQYFSYRHVYYHPQATVAESNGSDGVGPSD